MSFVASRLRAGHTPIIRSKVMAPGATGKKGAALIVDVNGKYATCAADPTLIAAFAESDYGPDTSGFAPLGVKEFPPGELLGCSVVNSQPFTAKYVGALPAAEGGTYGLVLDSDGYWKVDFGEVTVMTVRYLRNLTTAPESRGQVEVCVLPAAVQQNL